MSATSHELAGARPVPVHTAAPPHRPWCVDCKMKRDAHELDGTGRCALCARAVISRARAAERRAAEQAERRTIPTPQPRPTRTPTVTRPDPATPRRPRAVPTPRPRAERSTTVDTARIRRLYLDELQTIPAIARTTGHAAGTVRRTLLAQGVTLRDDRAGHSGGRNRLTPSPETVTAIVTRYVQHGCTIEAIAAEFSTGRRQVARILRDAGVTVRLPVNQACSIDDATRAAVVDEYLSGRTLIGVGAAFHMRAVTVASLVREAGHQVRARGEGA